MKKIITLIAISFILNGCASVLTYNHNKNNAYKETAYRSADPKMIQAYHNGDFHGLGINLTAMDVIFRSPGAALKQTGAGLLDLALGYGLVEVADSLNSNSDSDPKAQNGDGSASFDLDNSNENTFNIILGSDNDRNQDPTAY